MNLTMLQKYCDRTVQDFPFLVMLLLTAGGAVTLTTGAIWPLVWAVASVAIKFMDVRLIKQALSQANPEQATHTSFKANWFGIAFVYAYATLPTALLMTFRFELVMGGMALLIAGASRSVMMFSVSRNLGVAYFAPYFLVPALAFAGDILFSHDHSMTGHFIGIGALLCCLVYIWKSWHTRQKFEHTLTQLRASAEQQRDAAARDAAVSRLLFQQTSLRAALLDTDGVFIAANPSWLSAISKSETEILGQSFEVAMPFVAPQWRAAVHTALSGLSVQAKADKFVLPDGSSLYLDWDVQPWHTHDGAIGGVVVYAQDITEDMAHQEQIAALIARAKLALGQKRKMLEELCGQTALPQDGAPEPAPARLSAEKVQSSTDGQPTDNASFGQLFSGLEQILSEIDDRDVALAAAVQQLRDARASAEAANLAKSQFLANMSHELRTPLNAIIGYTEILIEDAEFDQRLDAANDASKVRNSATHLLGLINEILDLSKIEAGKMDITIEPIALEDVVNEVVADSKTLAAVQNNAIEVVIECERNVALTDGFRLRQCLLNLLSNACKFTNDGQITVTLTEIESDDKRAWFEIKVKDSGIGISPDQMPRLFRPFSQADGSTTRKYGGTGLGLALTREMTNLLGGEVFVESDLGKGSCFTLRLPALGLDAQDVRVSDELNAQAPLVLVIDDDPIARALTARATSSLGMTIASAETGHAALNFCEQNQVDLIVLDIQLPDMEGYDVLSALRGASNTRDIPVLVVSINDDRRKAIAAGAQEHLSKPCPAAVLTSAIARLAQKRSNPAPSADDDNRPAASLDQTPAQAQPRKPKNTSKNKRTA